MINKQEALKRLDSLDKEAAELRKIIETPEKPICIIERIKTFSDACNVLGINPTQVTNNTLDTKDEIAYKKLKIITKVLNEGWEPNWADNNQHKYFPWFEMKNKPGSGFNYSAYGLWHSSSDVSSRLAYKTKELALYAAKQFELEYYEYMTL